ncbi:hypothetical protein BaRGS_00010541 [Batillaria attramentaria]|uniref:Uncharacterized protein n=1 Tax=Batillaria attramentaria TaxID=370345 RepID=A0ABD0LFL5_9CAEN
MNNLAEARPPLSRLKRGPTAAWSGSGVLRDVSELSLFDNSSNLEMGRSKGLAVIALILSTDGECCGIWKDGGLDIHTAQGCIFCCTPPKRRPGVAQRRQVSEDGQDRGRDGASQGRGSNTRHNKFAPETPSQYTWQSPLVPVHAPASLPESRVLVKRRSSNQVKGAIYGTAVSGTSSFFGFYEKRRGPEDWGKEKAPSSGTPSITFGRSRLHLFAVWAATHRPDNAPHAPGPALIAAIASDG